MVPKFYAIDRAESVARRVARPAAGLQRRCSTRSIVALTAVSDRILRLLGVDMDDRAPRRLHATS